MPAPSAHRKTPPHSPTTGLQALALHLRSWTCCALVGLLMASAPSIAEPKFRLAWSIYVGWMPWDYAAASGIVDKWAKRYGVDIEVVQINDYIESINQFTAGAFDACTMTNMDMLTIPAAGGVDSTALLVGDFSNGNDGLAMKGANSLSDVRGQDVYLVELSVSHYLLARALDSIGLSERDVQVVNTSDADIVSAFATKPVRAVVTWNPQLSAVSSMPGAKVLFDSGDIPGEIIDLTAVNTDTLKRHPELGKALAGAWFETMAIMSADTPEGIAARTHMAEASGTDLDGYLQQLGSTRMFYDPAEAASFVRSPELMHTMELVRGFSFDHGLLTEGASSPDVIGIALPNDKVLGKRSNVKMRFTTEFMDLAAEGTL